MSDDKKPRGDLFFNTSKNTPLKKEPQNEGRANLTRLAGDVEELRKGSRMLLLVLRMHYGSLVLVWVAS